MGSKRGNNEGSIYPRKDGKWVAAITVGGGERRVFYGDTRREAAEKLTEALRKQQRGELETGPGQKVEKFLMSWLENVARPRVDHATYVRYEQFVRLQLVPHLGKTQLVKLSPQQVTAMYQKLGEGLSASTILKVHLCLHTALETAVRWGYVARNVCDLVDAPKVERYEFQVFTPDQARAFVAAVVGDHLEALYLMAITTGMREGELRGLKWADLDLAGSTVQVRRKLSRIKGVGVVEGEPKSRQSRRAIALVAEVVESLRRHRARQEADRAKAGSEWAEKGYVFTNEFGRPLEPTRLLRYEYYPLLARAGLPRIRFHDLRHSMATLMFALKTHPKIVQETLGHSSIALTLDTYSHAIPNLQDEAMEQLGGYLFSSGGAGEARGGAEEGGEPGEKGS